MVENGDVGRNSLNKPLSRVDVDGVIPVEPAVETIEGVNPHAEDSRQQEAACRRLASPLEPLLHAAREGKLPVAFILNRSSHVEFAPQQGGVGGGPDPAGEDEVLGGTEETCLILWWGFLESGPDGSGIRCHFPGKDLVDCLKGPLKGIGYNECQGHNGRKNEKDTAYPSPHDEMACARKDKEGEKGGLGGFAHRHYAGILDGFVQRVERI